MLSSNYNYKTIDEIAKELNVDKRKVYRITAELEKKKLIEHKKSGKFKLYDHSSFEIIKNKILNKNVETTSPIITLEELEINKSNSSPPNALTAFLMSQLDSKDKEIKFKNKEIDRLFSLSENNLIEHDKILDMLEYERKKRIQKETDEKIAIERFEKNEIKLKELREKQFTSKKKKIGFSDKLKKFFKIKN